jgi:branched-chain amino acid transport system permease protein
VSNAISHDFGYWLQQFLNALTLASFYMPLAVAYALVQGITNKIFLSFGDFAMYAAFAAIYAALAGQVAGNETVLVLLGSIGIAIACSSALGKFAANQVFAPLISKSSQAFMIASVGISIVLQEIMRIQSGNRDLWLPVFFDGQNVKIYDGPFPVQIGFMQIIAILLSLAAISVLAYVMNRTATGRFWMACSQSERLARLCGVNTSNVLVWSCVGSAALASVSGWIVAVAYGGVTFSMGLMLGFKAMFASVIGGFGTLNGAIVGGLFLAFVETLWTATLPLAYRDVGVFGFIILILVLKPEGILGSAVRRESEE